MELEIVPKLKTKKDYNLPNSYMPTSLVLPAPSHEK